jgi:hypothetical protein
MRAVALRRDQLLLGHSKLESTVRYLGIEDDDALELSEQTEIRRLSTVDGGRADCRGGGRPRAAISRGRDGGPGHERSVVTVC